MVKFTALNNNVLMVGLGLSAKNVELLKQDQPIKVNLKDLGIAEPIEIVIFYGETEAIMAESLMPMMAFNRTTTIFDVSEGDIPEGAETMDGKGDKEDEG